MGWGLSLMPGQRSRLSTQPNPFNCIRAPSRQHLPRAYPATCNRLESEVGGKAIDACARSAAHGCENDTPQTPNVTEHTT